jgi:hypothetical protein
MLSFLTVIWCVMWQVESLESRLEAERRGAEQQRRAHAEELVRLRAALDDTQQRAERAAEAAERNYRQQTERARAQAADAEQQLRSALAAAREQHQDAEKRVCFRLPPVHAPLARAQVHTSGAACSGMLRRPRARFNFNLNTAPDHLHV